MNLLRKLKYFIFIFSLGYHCFQYGVVSEEINKVNLEIMRALKEDKSIEQVKRIIAGIPRENLDDVLMVRRKGSFEEQSLNYYMFDEEKTFYFNLLGYFFTLSNFAHDPSQREMAKFLISIYPKVEMAYTNPISNHSYSPLWAIFKFNWASAKSQDHLFIKCKFDLELIKLLLKNGAAITSEIQQFAETSCGRSYEIVSYVNNLREAKAILLEQKKLRKQAIRQPSLELLKDAIRDDNPYVVYLVLVKGKLEIALNDLEDVQENLRDTRSERVINQYWQWREKADRAEKAREIMSKMPAEIRLPEEVTERVIQLSRGPNFTFRSTRMLDKILG